MTEDKPTEISEESNCNLNGLEPILKKGSISTYFEGNLEVFLNPPLVVFILFLET